MLVIPDLPFHIGPTKRPTNPAGIPNHLKFKLRFEKQTGLLSQVVNRRSNRYIQKAHKIGNNIGTPLSKEKHSKPYVDDFLSFIRKMARVHGKALEIGCGGGYLCACLKKIGWSVQGIEPGLGYLKEWKKNKIKVIHGFFPNNLASGPYDLIYSYAVLEHIKDLSSFLDQVKKHLAPRGKLILAVPDCTNEIKSGDPAMLLHEHFHYFNKPSLKHILFKAGFSVQVKSSGYGRAIYVSASQALSEKPKRNSRIWKESKKYEKKCTAFIKLSKTLLKNLSKKKEIGLYCPTRGLAVIPKNSSFRFFDDSPEFHGKYVPPHPHPIENFGELRRNPPEAIVILTQTFEKQIIKKINRIAPKISAKSLKDFLKAKGKE